MAWVKIVVAKLTHAMLINPLKAIQIFCEMDDFVKSVEKFLEGKILGSYSTFTRSSFKRLNKRILLLNFILDKKF